MKSSLEPQITQYIGHSASYALLAEVRTTPKPGLVDLHDNGAHKDMNYHTFENSTNAIVPYLTRMALAGFRHTGSIDRLFPEIRRIGVEAEAAMFQATGGVNTHKGIIFSMGILSAASAWYYREHGDFSLLPILDHSSTMTYRDLEQDFLKIDKEHPKTHGERLYIQYGKKGIRGEVQNGFPSVRRHSLPLIQTLMNAGKPKNLVFIEILLTLMSHVDDTNILIRSNPETLSFVKEQAARILKLGGAFTETGLDAVRKLNLTLIEKNVSPGGCADLLAITIFLWQLEEFKEG